jgi:hypothetical protein
MAGMAKNKAKASHALTHPSPAEKPSLNHPQTSRQGSRQEQAGSVNIKGSYPDRLSNLAFFCKVLSGSIVKKD